LKTWIDLTCLSCGFRFSPRKFTKATIQPIRYPAQIVTGGGRARGFHVIGQISWTDVAKLKMNPQIWQALNCEYIRLGSAYDNFYDYLGYLSPRMQDVTNALTTEIFRLRAICRELMDQLDRSRLNHTGHDSLGSFGRFLEEANKRDKNDRGSVRAILESG
jgi:hypothetical protein